MNYYLAFISAFGKLICNHFIITISGFRTQQFTYLIDKMILSFATFSIKEISEHIFDEGPDSIDFEGNFLDVRL